MARTTKVDPNSLPPVTRSLFEGQLKGSNELPASFHRSVFELATKAGATELVAELVGRLDAPADLVERYAQVKDVPVKVAYLTRPDHTPESLAEALKVEKRATVLSQILGGVAADSPTMLAICEAFLQRPTVALAEALASAQGFLDPVSEELEDRRNEVALKVVEVLAPRNGGSTSSHQAAFRKLVTGLAESSRVEETARIILDNQVEDLYVKLVSRTGISSETRLLFLESLATKQLKSAVDSRGTNPQRSLYSSRAVSTVMEACTALLGVPDIQDDVIARLKEISDHPILTAPEKDRLKVLVSGGTGGRDLTAYREASGDDLKEFISNLPPDDMDVLMMLLRNPNVTYEQALKLADRVNVNLVRRNKVVWETMADSVRDAFARRYLSAFQAADGWNMYRDGAAARQRLVDAAIAQWRGESLPSSASDSFLWKLIQDETFRIDPLTLPWPFIRSFTENRYYVYGREAGHRLMAGFVDRQMETLGEDLNRWETFNTLAGNFQGSVGELFDAVVLLTVR